MISFRVSDEVDVILSRGGAQLRNVSSMASWLIHQALLYPGVVEDIGPGELELTEFRRLRLGKAAMCRFDETVPAGMTRSDYARRLIRGGDAIITACSCWICAGYIDESREEVADTPLVTHITRLDESEVSLAERITISQCRTRISTTSFIVRLGFGGPEVDIPDQDGPVQSQRVQLPADIQIKGNKTHELRVLFHRGLARLRASECCRRMVEWEGGEPFGVFGHEMPMPGTPGYDELSAISGVGPFELTERAAKERERRIMQEMRGTP